MISVYRAFEECHSNNERKNNKFRENGEKISVKNLNKSKFHNDKLEKRIFK
jgi:hypothetical protein